MAEDFSAARNGEQLGIRVDRGPEVVTIALDGELDPLTVPLLQREVDGLVESGCHRLVFDMQLLRFIDSSGLRLVINVHKRLQDLGGSLVLQAPGTTASRLFEITGLAAHLTVVDS